MFFGVICALRRLLVEPLSVDCREKASVHADPVYFSALLLGSL